MSLPTPSSHAASSHAEIDADFAENPGAPSSRSDGRSGRGAWITAGALVIVVAALVLALVRAISVGHDNDADAGRLIRPTASQLQAVSAGSVIAANLLTLTRANFDSDYARALSGVTGKLKSDLTSNKADYLKAMTAGKFDLKGVPVAQAFESESNATVLMIVTINGYHVVDGLNNQVASPQRIELTLVQSGGKWLANDFTQVGIQ